MVNDWRKYRHLVKLDPDKRLSERSIERIVSSGTDGLMVSGTQNITRAKVKKLLAKLKSFALPKILEPPSPECILQGFDWLFIPSVLNSGARDWILGRHVKWIEKFKIDWDRVVPEAYIVLNPDSSVAKVTQAKTNLSLEEIVAYATCAEKYFKFPIVYIEYSGRYGDVKVVKAVAKALSKASLFYGGGINSREKALEMAKHASAIVVGNAFYEDLESAINTVVKEKRRK